MHKHRVKLKWVGAFGSPLVETKRPNPKAHGWMQEIVTCSCGAVRVTNINGREIERGIWLEKRNA